MSYVESVIIKDAAGDAALVSSDGRLSTEARISAGSNLDAFGRIRTAGTGQRLDVEFLYDKQVDYFDEQTNNGTVTFNGNSRDLTLSLSDANDGSYAWMSSFPVPYTPGNSQLIELTGTLDLAEIGSGTAETFLRSNVTGSVVTTTVEQSSWDSHSSGVDWTDSHIFGIDFQSLKVGTIRYFLVVDGAASYVNSVHNDDTRDGGYWQLPNLPVYYKLYTDSGTTYMELGYGDDSNAVGFRYKFTANASATMRAICSTVKSEGGPDLLNMPGLPRCADNAQTAVTVSTTLIPVLSIRPKSTFQSYANMILAILKYVTVETDNPIRLVGVLGGTLTGPSWTDVDATHSSMEYDVTASAITGGRNVMVEYFSSAGVNSAKDGKSLLGKTVLWDRQSSETGVFTLAAIRTGGVNADVLVSVNWEEIR